MSRGIAFLRSVPDLETLGRITVYQRKHVARSGVTSAKPKSLFNSELVGRLQEVANPTGA